MKWFVAGVLFLFTFFALAQSAPVGIAFMNDAQTVLVGAISETITIQAQDGRGNAFKLSSTGCVSLSSSASGEFSSNATDWSSVNVLTVNKGWTGRNFYYKGTAEGTHTLAVRLVLKPESESRSCASWPIAEWPAGWAATQQIVVGLGADIAEASATSTTSPESHSGPVNVGTDPVPSLIVKISSQSTAVVGADATFSATVFGVKKEPIPNARVIWSFGNGATKEGASVRYAYNIPGSYAVMVDAASGGLAGSARTIVVARKPDVRVSGVSYGANGFVEIENKSNTELDVSGWGIASGGALFTIPDHTIILPSAKVAFPSEVTHLSLTGNDARLLFPNGTLAAEYVPAPNPVNIPRPPQADTPFKGGIKNSPLEGSTPTPVGGRDVIIPTTTPAAVALSVTDPSSNNGVGVWIWGVLGVCVVGVGALAAFRFKPSKQEESEEKTFAEKVHIV